MKIKMRMSEEDAIEMMALIESGQLKKFGIERANILSPTIDTSTDRGEDELLQISISPREETCFQLFERYRRGDQVAAEEELYFRTVRLVRYLVCSCTQNAIEIEGLVRLVYLTFFKLARQGALLEEWNLYSVLTAITRCAVLEAFRSNSAEEAFDPDYTISNSVGDVASRLRRVDEAAALSEELKRLRGKISPDYQPMFNLLIYDLYIEGKDKTKIIAETAFPSDTLRRVVAQPNEFLESRD